MYSFPRDKIDLAKYDGIYEKDWFHILTKKGSMNGKHRAKIFLAFDALSGLKEGMDDARKQYVRKATLTQDRIEAINYTIEEAVNALFTGKKVSCRAVYFVSKSTEEPLVGHYEQVKGSLLYIDRETRTLCIEGCEIRFSNLQDFSFSLIQQT